MPAGITGDYRDSLPIAGARNRIDVKRASKAKPKARINDRHE
jgi:hypothetical protein